MLRDIERYSKVLRDIAKYCEAKQLRNLKTMQSTRVFRPIALKGKNYYTRVLPRETAEAVGFGPTLFNNSILRACPRVCARQ